MHRQLPVEGIPCARCGELIPVELPYEVRGIAQLSHREIFGFSGDDAEDIRPQIRQEIKPHIVIPSAHDQTPHVLALGEESTARLETLQDPPSVEIDESNWFDDLVEDIGEPFTKDLIQTPDVLHTPDDDIGEDPLETPGEDARMHTPGDDLGEDPLETPREDVRLHTPGDDIAPETQNVETPLPSRILLGTAALIVAVGVAITVYFWPEPETIVTVVEADPPSSAIHHAVLTSTRAESIAGAIARLRTISDEDLAKDVEGHIQKKNFGAAWDLIGELRSRDPGNQHYATLEIEALIGAQDFSEARQAALRGLAIFQERGFKDALQRAIQLDPRLRPEVVDLPKDIDVDALRPLGGGRSISLKFQKNGQNVYAFKPAQREWGDGWRSEVAAWRLCEIVVCLFEVPYSRSARITRPEFDRLYARQPDRQLTYAERFDELNWVIEEGPDGPIDVLYGVLKEWVPGFTDWPIEYTHVWKPWLSNQQNPELLQAPLKEAIQPLARYKNGDYVRNILEQHDGAPTHSIARQLSNILVFDYLTNNWDRFSGEEEFYGVNNQFAGGRFISLDNGAAFHLQSSTRVDARFAPVQRFSRATVSSIRNLDPSWTNTLLFPPIGLEGTENQRLNVFWARRQLLLNHIDQLRDTYGDEQTLFFP